MKVVLSAGSQRASEFTRTKNLGKGSGFQGPRQLRQVSCHLKNGDAKGMSHMLSWLLLGEKGLGPTGSN